MTAKSIVPLEKVTYRIYEDDARLLDAVAAASGMPLNALVRDIMRAYADRVRAGLRGRAPQTLDVVSDPLDAH